MEKPMSYMLLIMERADRRNGRPHEQVATEYERMIAFAKELDSRGLFKGAESLRSVAAGARVDKRAGKANIVDGPFAEAKEIVGGFIHVDCATKEEALALAQECPASEWSTVEVREVGPCYLS
jgi:hypothetical protein